MRIVRRTFVTLEIFRDLAPRNCCDATNPSNLTTIRYKLISLQVKIDVLFGYLM